MKQYLTLLQDILNNGESKTDRTKTGTLSVFGRQLRFNLQDRFPLLTTKKMHVKSIIYELLWFLNGDSNIKFLNENNVTIWDEWADEQGNLGPVYGKQWRSWLNTDGQVVDQIKNLLDNLKNNPSSRRHIVSAWNVGELHKMALPPCHVLFQFYVLGNKLSCQWYQRSCDVFLGLPFNIASYALLTYMVAHQLNLQAYELIFSGGDIHLYFNHIEQAHLQLLRRSKDSPQLLITNKPKDIFSYKFEDFVIKNYNPEPSIRAPIAI